MTSAPPPFPENLATGLARRHLPALDGLRAVAAFLVVFYHAGSPLIPGGLGVLAFFVLSGFLITWLLLAEDERYGGISLRLFYIRRSLRIFPAFYCYWLLVVVLLLLFSTHALPWAQILSSFFYVNNYYQAIHGDPNTLLSHTWSLGVEEQFYLLWPVTFLLLRTDRARLIRFLTGAILFVWFYRLSLFAAGVDQGYLYEAFDTRADHLLIGCLLAVVLRTQRFPRLWSRLCSASWLSAIPAGLLVVSALCMNRWGAAYRDTAGFLAEPVLVAVLIPQMIAFRASPLWSWTGWSWVRYLGRISYSIYLYQQIVPGLVRRAAGAWGRPAEFVLSVLVIVACAGASYYWIEAPFLRLKDRAGARREPRVLAGEPC